MDSSQGKLTFLLSKAYEELHHVRLWTLNIRHLNRVTPQVIPSNSTIVPSAEMVV